MVATVEQRPNTTDSPVPARHGPSRWLVALIAVLALVVGAAVGYVWSGSDDGSETEAVFDVSTDSFCEWFSAGDMNEVLAVAQARAGTDEDFEAFAPGGCQEEFPIWRAPGIRQGAGDQSGVHIALSEQPPDQLEVGPGEFVRHRLLGDDVSYQVRTNQFGWMEGVDGFVRVPGHEDEILYFGFGVDDHSGVTLLSGEYEDLGVAVVDELLRRMNWID